jgi:uncharacterized protein YndB with AHSA1/START domain
LNIVLWHRNGTPAWMKLTTTFLLQPYDIPPFDSGDRSKYAIFAKVATTAIFGRRRMENRVVASAEMLIRRSVAEVFEAFVDPTVTSRFWFSDGSGRLEPGKRIAWTWKWYNFSVDADVKAVEPNKRILVEWTGYGYPTPIEWLFNGRPDGATFVKVTNKGFQGTVEEAAQMAVDATEGFSFVLAGAKAWLEHGIQLNLVPDRFPDGLPSS